MEAGKATHTPTHERDGSGVITVTTEFSQGNTSRLTIIGRNKTPRASLRTQANNTRHPIS
jgi:hypothetical protein